MEHPETHAGASESFVLLKKRPWFAGHTLLHKVFFWFWLGLGFITLGLTLYEQSTGSLKARFARELSADIGRDFRVPPLIVEERILPYLERVSDRAVLLGVLLMPIFFTLAFYCRRLVVKGRYINRLEQALKNQTFS